MVRIPLSYTLFLLTLTGCSGGWQPKGDRDEDGFVWPEDCWDDPVGPLGDEGPTGAEINPDAEDAWYDGVDADCAGGNDFDQDGDGFASANHVPPGGAAGDDCNDEDPAIKPDAAEIWYEGIDQNCDGNDMDQDADGYPCLSPADENGFCDGDCNDLDPSRYPTGQAEQIWYDGEDDNCDGNDGDQDGDGYWISNYEALSGQALPDSVVGGDCLDSGTADALDPFADLESPDVHPNATETWYDGIDQDCALGDDFDADRDGQRSLYFPDEAGLYGIDCFDVAEDVSEGRFENPAGLDEDEVFEGAEESWYDGTDQNCAGDSDYDKDLDGEETFDFGGTDCDDDNDLVNTAMTENCSTLDDDNCNGYYNEQNATDSTPWYLDTDGDGYGTGSAQNWCAGGDSQSHYTAEVDGDCNDGDATINPAATEACDGGDVDEDCDGLSDDADASPTGQSTWYADGDGDGYGEGSSTLSACDQPVGYISNGDDCDDGNPEISPVEIEICDDTNTDEDCDGMMDDGDASVDASTKTTFYLDGDGDGYGSTTSTTVCDVPTGYVSSNTDCADAVAAINPGAQEICDSGNTDEDCDGLTDDSDSSVSATGKVTWYPDADGDAYSSSAGGTSKCDAPTGYIAATTADCNDAVSSVHPGATEVCDPTDIDENCNGTADDSDTGTASAGKSTWYQDQDGDGYGTSTSLLRCNQPTGYVSTSGDCDDQKSTINPNAAEVCDDNNADENCDGTADDDDSSVSAATKITWYEDWDSDGYGTSASSLIQCDQPNGYVDSSVGEDCNDGSTAVNPGASEECDGANVDEDCDGLADDNDPSTLASGKSVWYRDADGDSHGTIATTLTRCDQPATYVATSGDCNDGSNVTYPGAAEVAEDNLDNDCDSTDDARFTGTGGLLTATATYTGASHSSGTGSLGGVMAGGYDVNGDGYADVLISDRNYDSGSVPSSTDLGLSYLQLGSSTGLASTLSSVTYQLIDINGSVWSGQGSGMVGDTNTDGYDELLVGAFQYNPTAITDAGRVALFRGASSLIGAKTEANATILITGTTASDYVGWTTVGLGDVIWPSGTADAKPDWAFSSMASTSAVYVVSGALAAGTTYSPATAAAATITAGGTSRYLGASIAGDFDYNGDGFADLVLSSPGTSSVLLFAGPLTGAMTDGDANLSLTSINMSTWSGTSSTYFVSTLASAGDTNGDSYDDLLVGAEGNDSVAIDAGAAYLFRNLANGSGTSAVTLTGAAGSDGAGKSVSGGIDVDRDGRDDVLIGVPGAENGATTNAGAAVLLYGSTADGTYTLATLGAGGAIWYGAGSQYFFGNTVLAAGDTNGDNYEDFLFSAFNGKNGSSQVVGLTYYFQGTGE